MNRFLTPGQVIKLENRQLRIIECAGSGHSCTTYFAEEIKNDVVIQHMVKEYNPRNITLTRDKNLNMVVEEEDLERYKVGMERLNKAAVLQNVLRKENELTNSICNVHDIIDAYNTCYIDMQVQAGKTYNDFRETNLQGLLKRIRTIVSTVEKYHKAGYLLLDIKPDNLFVLNETTDLVLFFDFDSVIRKSELERSDCISFTYEWSAPELICESLSKNISEVSDYFSIGEILFYKLFGRHSCREERRAFSKYEFENSEFYSTDLNPRIWKYLAQVFRNTLCCNAKRRYSDASAFICALDEIIQLAEPNSYYLVGNIPEGSACFLGREHEYEKIKELLQNKKSINICGDGGIGKTELVKHYACDHIAEFDTVLFFTFKGSWKRLINNSVRNQIPNFKSDEEKEEDLFDILIRILNKIVTDKTLIIIDNVSQIDFGRSESDERDRISGLPWKIVYTSRSKIDILSNYEIKELPKKTCEELVRTFLHRETVTARKSISQEMDVATEIVEACDSNTLLMKIVSKLFRNCKLNAQKRSSILKQLSRVKDAEKSIGILFGNYLNAEQKYILYTVSLMPVAGISFSLLCKHVDKNEVNSLINCGWLEQNNFGVISIHSVICKAVQAGYVGGKTALSRLMRSLWKNIDDMGYNDNLLGNSKEYQEMMLSMINHIAENVKDVAPEAVCLLGLYGWDEIIDRMDYEVVKKLYIVFEGAEPALDEEFAIDPNYKVLFLANYLYLLSIYFFDKDVDALIDKAWNIANNPSVTLENKLILYYFNAKNVFSLAAGFNTQTINDAQKMYKSFLEMAVHAKPTIRMKTLIAKTMFDIGFLLRITHVLNVAEEFFRVGLTFAPETSLIMAKLLHNYSLVKEAQGDYMMAIDLCEKSISIKEKLYGYKARQLCDNLRLLSRLCRKTEDDSRSIKIAKMAFEIAISSYGESSTSSFCCYALVEAYETDAYRYSDEIKQLLWRARMMLEDGTMGPSIIQTAGNYYRFGHYYYLLKNYSLAEDYFKRSIELYEMDANKNGVPTTYPINLFWDKAYYFLGNVLKHYGLYEDAIDCYNKAAELLELSHRDDLKPARCIEKISKIRALM